MKCPICEKETKEDICPICGYDLENDIIFNNNIQRLSQHEIDKHKRQIEILKKQFNKPKYNNILDNKDINEIEELAEQYYRSREYIVAAILYNEAKLRGSISSSVRLGYMYERGLGVKRDYLKAKECYEIGCDNFDSLALYKLGYFYENGYGVEADYVKARRLYIEASDLGESAAMTALGQMYEKGLGVDINYIKAKRWYLEAADFSDGEAMLYLGKLYEEGKGTDKNIQKAIYYYKMASEFGYLEAYDKYKELTEGGIDDEMSDMW